MFPALGGGRSLGVARGSIEIDTRSLEQAAVIANRVGRDIGRTLGGQLASGVGRAQAAISSLRGELVAIGATAGAATLFGIGSARDLRAYRIAFETILGSQGKAVQLMSELADGAGEYGLELTGVLGLARNLLPILEGNVEATQDWVRRAALLRSVLPSAQQGAELRAISEYLAGQTMSLQRLFNIPPNLIQEAKNQFADAGQQLDFILQRMGATEEAARRMADPVVSVRNELRLIAAIGFGPLLEDVRDLSVQFREWLEEIRETNPELLKIGASAITAVAVGAPLLVFLNQVLSTLQAIASSRGLLALGRLGLIGGAAALGARELVRGRGRARGDEDMANIGFREMIFEAFRAFNQLTSGVALLMANAAKNFAEGVASMIVVMGRFVQRVADFLPGFLGGNALRQRGQQLVDAGTSFLASSDARFERAVDKMVMDMDRIVTQFGVWVGVLPSQLDKLRAAEQEERRRTPTADPGGGGGRLGQLFRDTVANAVPGGLAEWSAFWAEMQQIQADAAAEILAAEQEHQAQRQEIIASFNRQMARDEEDFQRQRARAQEDFQRQIDEINQDRIEREAEWQDELNERLAEIQADAARERERMEEDHRDNLLSAASRLDARAVAEENRRYAQQRQRFEEDLQERIENEKKAHRERVENAREADQERLEDLREFHERRLAREDEDREIRLARMQEDHERQLEQFDEQHQARIDQIKDQAADERAAAADAYRDRLREQGIYYTSFLTEQARRQGDSLRSWRDFWDDFQRAQQNGQRDGRTGGDSGRGGGGSGGGNRPTRQELVQQGIDLMQEAGWDPRAIYNMTRVWRNWTDAELAHYLEKTFGVDIPGYLMGTPFVRRTGLAMLHRGEMVIDPQTAAMARATSGNPYAQAGMYAAGGRSIQMGDVTIAVQGSTNMNEAQLKRAVRSGIMDALREVAN